MSTREIKNKYEPTTTSSSVADVYSKEKAPASAPGLIHQISEIEKRVFGSNQTGSLVERLEGLEKKVKKFSSSTSNPIKLEERLNALSEALSGSGPAKATSSDSNKKLSLEEILKKVERELGLKPDPSDDLDQRIRSAEKVLRGVEATGGLYGRAKKLYEEIFGVD